jgi:hypothetical protein
MDQVTLVDEQADQGWKLVERLRRDGFDVTAACWVKEAANGRWYLYLASPVVDAEGKREAYGRINEAIRRMPPPFWIDPLAVRVFREDGPVAEAVAAARERYPGRAPVRLRATRVGSREAEEVYVYPRPVAASVSGPS